MRLRVLGMLACVFALLPSAANAAYVLEFGQGGVAGISSFNAAPGDMVTIELYLTQTGADSLLTNKGIATMALDFTIDGAGGAIHDNVAGASTFVFNPGFSDVFEKSLSGNFLSLGLDAATDGSFGVKPAAGNSVLLGTANIQGISAGVYNLDMASRGGFSFTTLDLDLINPTAGNATLTLSAVPEPGSFAVLGLIGSGVLVRMRRRKAAK